MYVHTYTLKHSDTQTSGGLFSGFKMEFFNLTFFFFLFPYWESTPYSSHIPQGNGNHCMCVCVVMYETIHNSIHLAKIPLANNGHYSSADTLNVPDMCVRYCRKHMQHTIQRIAAKQNVFHHFSLHPASTMTDN